MTEKGTIYAGKFHCGVPLKMLEACNKCSLKGRCKERGYLMAILLNKKKLTYDKDKEKK